MTLSKEAREKRRAYQREWYKNNKDKHKEYMARYWERKADEAQEEQQQQEADEMSYTDSKGV